MNPRARILITACTVLLAILACNLPVEAPPPAPFPTQTALATLPPAPAGNGGPTQPRPTAGAPTAPTPQPTAPSTATQVASLPTVTSVPTLTRQPATATATATTNKTIAVMGSPTAPSTLTPGPNPTKTRTSKPVVSGRGVIEAVYFDSPPNLDGVWDEWKDSGKEYPMNSVVFGAGNWMGAEDLSGSLRAGWDETNLYLAVKIRDDVYAQNAAGSNLYLGDSLEVLLDTNLTGDLSARSLNADDYQLGISPGRPDVDGKREAFLWFPRSSAGARSQVKIAAVRQEGVTRIEVAIPWSLLKVSPFADARYGFTLSFSDNDNPDANEQQSMIASQPGRVLVDPTTWGELRLK